MPIKFMKAGDRVRVKSVTGSGEIRKHLGALSLVPGAIVTVVNSTGGNMILGVHDSRIAIGEDIARHLMVESL